MKNISQINLHIQTDTGNKCGVPTTFVSASDDKSFLKSFFQTTRVVIVLRRRHEGPLNLKMSATL